MSISGYKGFEDIMTETKVVNILKGQFDVYIGRKGRGKQGYFGNPYPLKDYGRKGCISEYSIYFHNRIKTDPEFKQRVEELKGKRLGCFCAPLECHGDVIKKYLDAK